MAKRSTSNSANAIKQAIEQLKRQQSPRIPGTHPEPFLTDPAQIAAYIQSILP